MDVDFSDILEKSRALRSKQEASTAGFGDNIPRLERALPQIDRESRRLATRPSEPDENRALRLLSEQGFETEKIERTLQSFVLQDAFGPSQSIPDTDIDGFLNNRRELYIASAIEDTIQHVNNMALETVQAEIDDDWERKKRELVSLPSLAYRRQSRQIATPKTVVPGGAFASPFRHPRAPRKSLDQADQSITIYESIVRRAVHARANPTAKVAIATELDDALVANLIPRGDPATAPKRVQHLHAVFTALRYIIGEEGVPQPVEGAFGGMHSAMNRRQVCIGALRFLSLQFREDKMRREIEARPVEARRGGVPGLRADVRAYLNLVFGRGIPEQLAKGTCYDGMPIWPQVYYSLRAGDMGTCLEILNAAIMDGCTDPCVQLYKECAQAFETSGDSRGLPSSLLDRLTQDYWLSAKNGDDPYHRVCYLVMARIDPAAGEKMSIPDEDYSLLFYSIEDYLWLRLSLVHVEGDQRLPDSLATYQLSMKSIREEIKSFGPAHFDPQGETPAFYALVLLLTGQFSEAVAYLDHGARAIAEAVHIAYTLYYYGILRESMGEKASDADPDSACYMIEYAELVWRYVSNFSRTDSTAAAVYMFTIREANLRNELLRKLILETKDFDKLLGTSGSTMGGQRERSIGVLEELWPLGGHDTMSDQSWLSVVESAAESADAAGDRDSALQLYDVAGMRGKVMAIYINRLSAVLTSRDSPSRAEVFRQARTYRMKMDEGYALSTTDAQLQSLIPSFDMLVSLGEFFDLLWAKKYEEARVLLDKLALLPSNDAELVSKTQELKLGGGVWADGVCDRVPEVLLGAMEVLASLYAQYRNGDSRNGVSGGSLRSAARTLVNFSGMMPNGSADISARVVRLEILMSC